MCRTDSKLSMLRGGPWPHGLLFLLCIRRNMVLAIWPWQAGSTTPSPSLGSRFPIYTACAMMCYAQCRDVGHFIFGDPYSTLWPSTGDVITSWLWVCQRCRWWPSAVILLSPNLLKPWSLKKPQETLKNPYESVYSEVPVGRSALAVGTVLVVTIGDQ